jgi:hypothetical protein
MFVLNQAIEIGDIVLLAGGSKHSAVISFFTNGPFSHACVIVGRSQIIEALTSSGVQYTSCLRIAVADRANIAVLSPIFPDEARATAVRSEIEDLAKAFQSRAYGLIDALKMPLLTQSPLASDKFFCSSLVAAIYRVAKFPLFDEKLDHNVSPNDFLSLRNSVLTDVTDDVVMEPPDYIQRRFQREGTTPLALDTGESTASQHAILFQEFISESGPIFKAHGIRPPSRMFDIIDALSDASNAAVAPTVDRQLAKLFDSKNILAEIRSEISSMPQQSFEELEEEILIFGRRFVEEEHHWCLEILDRFKSKLVDLKSYREMFSAVYEARGLVYAKRMCEYYELLIYALNKTSRDINERATFLAPHLKLEN